MKAEFRTIIESSPSSFDKQCEKAVADGFISTIAAQINVSDGTLRLFRQFEKYES